MEPFLKSVAHHIYKHHQGQFENLAIVFPNRRSGVFFLEHFKQLNQQTIWLPQILTINEFISKLTPIQITEPINLLATLYNLYKKISNSNEPFDEFYIWGQLMLNDFDDVDKYLVNPDAIFTNVKEFKTFDQKVDYLTDEQKSVLKQFFNQFDPEKKTQLKENFLEIWQVMLPIYTQLHDECLKNGFGYEGLIYRQAAQNIQSGNNPVTHQHIAFVGFNAINRCEEVIFGQLKKQNMASFYWDFDPYFVDNLEQEAGMFIRRFLTAFPNPADFKPESQLLSKTKHIELISSPTVSGQLGIAASILSRYNLTDHSKTALVLADEALLQPSLFHIPEAIPDVNITMGYSVQNSLALTFIDLIFDLQLTRREVNGKAAFYHKKVIPILRHPFTVALSQNESLNLVAKLTSENRFYIEDAELESIQVCQLIFNPIDNATKFAEYLRTIIDYLVINLMALENHEGLFTIDTEFLYHINLKNNQLTTQLSQNNISVALPTYFKLLKKALASLSIPFEGEPIKGLQIMGFLETRNLDFDHVIITSFNEGQLPFSQSGASFIPYSLRRGFGLPTREMQDAMYAYYFFRLLQRSNHLHLIYCSSAEGTFTGEPSRFAYQLQYNNAFHIDLVHTSQSVQVMVSNAISIQKSGSVKDVLQTFFDSAQPAAISPSAVTTYLTCPLKFYFHSVLKLYEADTIEDQVDARLFGNIFHLSAQYLYQPNFERNELVTTEVIKTMVQSDKTLSELIQKAFNETFHKFNPEKVFQIEGKNSLVSEAIKTYLQALLKLDQKAAPFSIVGLEKEFDRFVPLDAARKIRIKGHIDRIDRTDKGLRIIDYKTGGDDLKFSTIDDLFNPQNITKHKAVIQTFLYSWICESQFPTEMVINPKVYKVKQLFDSETNFEITSSGDKNYDGNFKTLSKPFETQLANTLSEIFNLSVPFRQTTDNKHCSYCPYKGICNK